MFTTCVTKNNTRDYFSLSKSSRRRWVVVVVGGRENWNRCCATTPATAFDDDDDDDWRLFCVLEDSGTPRGVFFWVSSFPRAAAAAAAAVSTPKDDEALTLPRGAVNLSRSRRSASFFARSWSKVKVWVSLESSAAVRSRPRPPPTPRPTPRPPSREASSRTRRGGGRVSFSRIFERSFFACCSCRCCSCRF